MESLPYNHTQEGGITTIINCESYQVSPEHPKFNTLLKACRDGDEEKFLENYSRENLVEKTFEDTDIFVEDGAVFRAEGEEQAEELDGVLVERIVDLVESGQEGVAEPFIRFLDNLMDNPSYRAVDELYEFLQHKNLPITDDGCFLAYKNVRPSFYDWYSNSIYNGPDREEPVEMPRYKVDDNRHDHCSQGLHVGAWEYAGRDGWYHGNKGHTILVKVNPRDAVSVPADHNKTKLRTCKYEVVDVHDDSPVDEPLYTNGENNMSSEEEYELSSEMKGALNHLANRINKYSYIQDPAEDLQSEVLMRHDINPGEEVDRVLKALGELEGKKRMKIVKEIKEMVDRGTLE